jgi:HK97 gp10 family phage protein
MAAIDAGGSDAHVTGLSDLLKFMDQLTPKIEANVARGALRAGMNVVKPVAQQNIHRVSGKLAEGLKVGTRRRGHIVTSTLKATGPHRSVAQLVEFGTSAHNIAAKFGGWLSFMNIFRKEIAHPGARPHPFMRPALDGQAQAAVIAVGEYIKTRLATKEGLDTSHITIEGDE